jgi:hypothetical protein
MILGIWKPKYEGSGKNKKIIYYSISDEINKSNLKIVYTCDNCLDNIKYVTDGGTILKSKYVNINKQLCKSCISKISEYVIKNSRIPFMRMKESFINNNYELITTEEEYLESENSSQFILKSICSNNHEYKCNWNNWNDGRRCRKCYDNNRKENALKYKDGFELYRYLVRRESEITYSKYKDVINPNNLKRGLTDYHLDHIYSIYDGFKNNIPVYIISSVENLRILRYDENIRKGCRSE